MRFLFIEDSNTFFQWVAHPLEESGHVCVNAVDVEQARDILATEKFDAIFVDLNMPRYTPAQVMSIAKTLANGTPAIVLTGESMRSDLSRVADGFIFKDSLNSGEDVSRILPAFAKSCRDEMETPSGRIDQGTKLFDALRLIKQSA